MTFAVYWPCTNINTTTIIDSKKIPIHPIASRGNASNSHLKMHSWAVGRGLQMLFAFSVRLYKQQTIITRDDGV